jgi:hypothetical protein
MVRRSLTVDERHVGNTRVEARAARHRDPVGGLVQPIMQNRDVVRSEVPHHADVSLMKPQVDSRRGDEEDLTQLSRVDDLLDLVHRRAEHEGVAHHEGEAKLPGQGNQLLRLGGAARHGLLDEHVLAGEQGRFGKREVRGDGRGDDDRVDLGVGEHESVVGGAGHRRITTFCFSQGFGTDVAEPLHPNLRELDVVSQKVRAPIAVAYDRDGLHGFTAFASCSAT